MPPRRGLLNLVTIADSDQVLRARFPVWPDVALTSELLELLQGQLPAVGPEANKLLEAGFVTEHAGQIRPALPVYESCRTRQYQDMLQRFGSRVADDLAPFIGYLHKAWPHVDERQPAWEHVAHSLVMVFLLGVCGGKLLLKASKSSTAALMVKDPAKLPGTWHSFIRLRPDLAVSNTVGSAYPSSELLCHLLRQQELVDTLVSVDAKGQLIVYGDKTLRLLRRLSAYRQTSPGPWLPNDYWLSWPIITPEMLQPIKRPLELACRALNLVVKDLLQLIDGLDLGEGMGRADLGLMGLIDLAGISLQVWLKAGLLPPIAIPWLDDWQMPEAQGGLQSDLLKAIAR